MQRLPRATLSLLAILLLAAPAGAAPLSTREGADFGDTNTSATDVGSLDVGINTVSGSVDRNASDSFDFFQARLPPGREILGIELVVTNLSGTAWRAIAANNVISGFDPVTEQAQLDGSSPGTFALPAVVGAYPFQPAQFYFASITFATGPSYEYEWRIEVGPAPVSVVEDADFGNINSVATDLGFLDVGTNTVSGSVDRNAGDSFDFWQASLPPGREIVSIEVVVSNLSGAGWRTIAANATIGGLDPPTEEARIDGSGPGTFALPATTGSYPFQPAQFQFAAITFGSGPSYDYEWRIEVAPAPLSVVEDADFGNIDSIPTDLGFLEVGTNTVSGSVDRNGGDSFDFWDAHLAPGLEITSIEIVVSNLAGAGWRAIAADGLGGLGPNEFRAQVDETGAGTFPLPAVVGAYPFQAARYEFAAITFASGPSYDYVWRVEVGVVGAPAVPALGSWGRAGATAALALLGALSLARRRAAAR